jgi:hypothetical protein
VLEELEIMLPKASDSDSSNGSDGDSADGSDDDGKAAGKKGAKMVQTKKKPTNK